MSNLYLHIVSFTIPDPPDYGGVIDVFYKIKALSEAGVRIILHCFQYDGRLPSKRLNSLCQEVHYYKRNISIYKAISTVPYIVASRNNDQLVKRLQKDNYPILFEGLHTIGAANHPSIKGRKIAVRMHNIEWKYYDQLALQEPNLGKKIYFKVESLRLRSYQKHLGLMNKVFTISHSEQQELSKTYNNCSYLPVFHENNSVNIKDGTGTYILYHGNLSIAENKASIEFIFNILDKSKNFKTPIVIAGKGKEKDIEKYQSRNKNQYTFCLNPSEEKMKELIRNAQLHFLITFQSTGVKLKLINALFNGRHIVVNKEMVVGSGLENLCHILDFKEDNISALAQWLHTPISEKEIQARESLLSQNFSNKSGAELIITWLNCPQ